MGDQHPAGVRKPDVFIVPRDVARAAIIDESPRLIPGTELYLVNEVICSGSGSERTDRLRKVSEYSRLGIPQYWIVEHRYRLTVQVLTLADGTYRLPHRGRGHQARSRDRRGQADHRLLRPHGTPRLLTCAQTAEPRPR
jgi:Uma2 family endonuclease